MTKDLQDCKAHQAHLDLVVLVQVDLEPQVSPVPQAQKERKVVQAYLAMAQKDYLVRLDFQDLLDLPALRALPVHLMVALLVTQECQGSLAPEGSRVTQDLKASEVSPATVPA